jgi:DNA-binding transcriptional regulator LsrR (DeoR family)
MSKLPIPLALLAAIARDRFVGDLTEKELASKYGKSQGAISRDLKAAKDMGLVSIRVDVEFAVGGKEDARWSRNLRDSFGLNETSVMESPSREFDLSSKAEKLHTALANFTGQKMRESLRSGDHLAVSAGRCVSRMAQFLDRNPPVKSNIRISPLSGRLWTGAWQMDGPDNVERPLDADDTAFVLAGVYS